MNQKQLLRTLVFLMGISLLLFGFNYALIKGVRSSEHAQTGKVSLLMSHKIDPQLMIFGASNGETGIASSVLADRSGKTVFNLCLDGTSVLQFADLVREFNDYSKQGETVLFTMGPFALESTGLPYAMNRYYAWSDNKYIKQNAFLHQVPEFKKLQHVPLYGYVLYDAGFYKSALDGWSRKINHPLLASSLDHQGWVPMSVQWDNNITAVSQEVSLTVDSVLVAEYKKLTQELKEKGKKVVFVIMPCEREGMQKMKGYESFRQAVKELAAAADGYLDFSEDSMSMDKRYFYNYTHLNRSGAKFFSEKLADKLKD